MISIHAPREGSDAAVLIVVYFLVRFLSTLPARGATLTPTPCVIVWAYFYQRSPRGERLKDGVKVVQVRRFLSTLPARGATVDVLGVT